MSLKSYLLFILAVTPPIHAEEKKAPYSGAGCAGIDHDYFASEVWTKVAAAHCLKCHKPGGDAEDSELILQDPRRLEGAAKVDAMRANQAAFAAMAKALEKGQSRLLVKSSGQIDHGGDDAIDKNSPEFRILAEFTRRTSTPLRQPLAAPKNTRPFFEGVAMLDDRRLLRRTTLSLAGRLPTEAEYAAVAKSGLKGIPAILDQVMKEDAFYDRLREAFNDIFLTTGYDGGAETAFSYEHFPSRGWAEKFDLNHIADEKARQQARYKLYADYRKAMLGEPMKLIEHIVRNDHPFTEIVTADYIMVTPFTSRGYGIFEEVKAQFKNPEDPFEYIPVKLKALIGRDKRDNQESATGFYPHAGLLSTFQYLRRYPTTETNRNRLRARMYFQQFLGIDVLELAARVSDAAAVTAKFEIPTMQASECVVCHKTIDPVAGLFQDYWKFEGVYGRRKEGWFTDMFAAGYEGEDLPAAERWRALQWLGERTARDPRFAAAMVEHGYYLMTGRKVLLPPKDLEDPLYEGKHRAYLAQRQMVDAIAIRFTGKEYNFKNVLKDLAVSDFYRADGLATAAADPNRQAELDDVGLVRMLAPEQVERKISAVFGKPWGRLTEQIAMLYGGIDAKEVTERATDPSGAMGAIQRIMANDVACKNVAKDFSLPNAERLLFPGIEPDVLPGTSPEADAKIRATLAHLHQRILGRDEPADSFELELSYELFAGMVAEAATQKLDPRETYHCRRDLPGEEKPDPHYTVRAWRGVVTYLLRQPDFLYE